MSRILLRHCSRVLAYGSENLSSISFSNRKQYHDYQEPARYGNKLFYSITAGTLIGLGFWLTKEQFVDCATKETKAEKKKHETIRSDLPTFTADDVTKHSTLSTGIWVSYGSGVYDITSFIPEHPGSDKIMLGAGAAIDPFWFIYQQHNQPEVLALLEKYRIGNLREEDKQGTADLGDPWSNEPKRHPLLKPTSQKPFNAEPPVSILADNFITPTEFFYIQNHLPVPEIVGSEYELELESEINGKKKTLKLADIKKYPKTDVVAAIMCGGNRRSEIHKIKEVKGLSWGAAAVGNAVWSGVKLADVLKEMGVESDETSHVQFEGLDTDPTNTPYGASIPLSKACDPRGGVILAYEMNGKTLNRDHGFPIRVIVPGVVGARNVKWLGKIIVSKEESNSHWQQNDYKSFSPSTDWDTVNFKSAPAIQNMPVTSAICSPNPYEKEVKIVDGCIEVKGYAWSGGGNKIIRVDITGDRGNTWHVADLEQLRDDTDISAGKHFAWSLWTVRIPLEKGQKDIEIWSKAVDSNYNCQPETFKNIWNLRGVVGNAYHRIKVKLLK